MSFFINKKFAAFASVASNLFLIVLKLAVGFISGSVSIISEAIHSGSDFFASVIACVAVHKSEKPADSDHQFGHGKYEDVAGFVEGTLIILASFFIVYEAVKRLSGMVEPLNNSALGIFVMSFSVVVNILVSQYLFFIAKKTDSIALYSDAQHLRTDIYSSLTVLIGLLIIKFTGLHFLDSVFAIIVSIIIMQTGYRICKSTLNDLLDGSLPQKDIDTIKSIVNSCADKGIIKIKEVRTRKSGKDKDIVIVLVVDGNLTVYSAHKLCDNLENQIEDAIGNTKIIIHTEPDSCVSCQNVHN